MAVLRFPDFFYRRWLWAVAGFLFVVPAFVLAAIYLWLLPNLSLYKDQIASLLSSASGYTITFESMAGEWGGARPHFKLEGVRVTENRRPMLFFSKLQGSFGWRTLLALEPRFHDLNVDAPGLTIRRGQDGFIHVGGFKFDPNSAETPFSDWLLRQGSVSMEGATLAWIDDTRSSQPLVLRNVTVKVQNFLGRHAFRASLNPPAHMARPLVLEGVVYGKSLSKLDAWRGKVSLNAPALDLASWGTWLPGAYAKARGHGSVQAEAEIEHGRPIGINAKLNLADLYLETAEISGPIDLSRLTGEIGWMRAPGANVGSTQTAYARAVSIRDRSGNATAPFDLSYQWGADEQKITAAKLSLSEFSGLVPTLPLQESWKSNLAKLDLRGVLDSLDLRWKGAILAPEQFSVDARFTGLGWSADGDYPGAANLSGMLEGNQAKGSFNLTGTQTGFDFPTLFEQPQFRFDTLNMRGTWAQGEARHYTFEIAEAALSNPDFAATLYGSYRIGGPGPGTADLNGRLERAQGPRVERYLPFAISEGTHAWLRDSILRGEVRQGTFKLKGDLSKFPFKSSAEGIFRVAGKIHGGQLRYAQDYPQIDDIVGDIAFDGIRMEMHSDSARIYGAQLKKVKAVIPDLETTNELLEVGGEAVGPAQEFIRFANFSPVNELIGNVSDEMTATGDMRLQLNIKVPLRHAENTTLAGRLVFNNNTVFPGPDRPRLEEVSGMLDFTDKSVSTRSISARLLGGATTLTAATESGGVTVRARGTFSASALETWFGQNVASRLSGQADWKGELRFDRKNNWFRLESNLLGIDARLPAPINKTADKTADFIFESRNLDGGSKWSSLQYGNIVNSVWISTLTPAGFKLERGELNFGGKASLPDGPGLQVSGNVLNFDLGGWADLQPPGQSGRGAVVSGLNLSLGSLEFLGRQFHDIELKGKLKDNLLRASVSGREMTGNLTYRRPEAENVARISAQFKQFTLPDPLPYAQMSGNAAMQLKASSLPMLDLQIDDLKFGSRPMGRLEIVAHGVQDGMAIEQLNLLHADSVIRMTGFWKDTGLGETRMKMNVDIKDAGQMMGRFGHPNSMRKGTATVEGEVTWLRSPADFSFATLDGTLKLNARNGQFLKVDAGAGKLLGIASLQSLPRRITLDFRDVFSEGFAFDEISSTMQVADGAVYTNDFLMKGPAATVKMSGVAKLRDETVKLRVKVSPKLTESVAVAGALLGGPIAGVGALVMQKVLKDPIEEATSYEYLVDGPWDKPSVTKLAKPKTQEKEPDS